MNKKPKVFVGVSGGVDSSVSLALLQNQGFDVTGVFLKVWYPDFMPCDWKEERLSAMRVCATLNVPFITLDCEKEYKKEVVDYMISEYKSGRIPNPDIFCNKYVKFGVFLKKAIELGADFIATGHYAINHQQKDGTYELKESLDKEKDQSYFLYTLTQNQLKHIILPVGNLTKPEVRRKAEEFKLHNATKKDSQGLCFMGKVDVKKFLSHYIETKKGDVLNTDGVVIGEHDGSIFYTIGQRHGFNITQKTPNDPRYIVISKDLEKNTITVAGKEVQKEKIKNIKKILLNNVNFISGKEPQTPLSLQIRIRYRQEKKKSLLKKENNNYYIEFCEDQEAVAVGQSAVFYQDEICLGGGIIEKAY